MPSDRLENLVKTGGLTPEPASAREVADLVRSGTTRLSDARLSALSLESRFDLAYNAAHALDLAALRHHGYRSKNRYLVFQALEHTLGLPPSTWRVLATCHEKRNLAEYEGHLDVTEQLVEDLVEAAGIVLARLQRLTREHEAGDAEP